ncbi:hypothetical protein JMJ77_0007088, partial [Colletotrichum scovillei]
ENKLSYFASRIPKQGIKPSACCSKRFTCLMIPSISNADASSQPR